MHAIHFRIKMLFKYKDLISQLVIRDLKLKYRRSFLGYVWSICHDCSFLNYVQPKY